MTAMGGMRTLASIGKSGSFDSVKPITAFLALALAGCATPVPHSAGLTGRPADMREAKATDFNFNLPRDYQAACGYLGKNGIGSGKPADCDRLSEAEYYTGTWLMDRETSFFSFDGQSNCWDDYADAVECVDLEMSVEQHSQIQARRECTKVYRLEFIGRHTVRPVMVDMGYPSHVIVVERIVSGKLLGPAARKHNICGSD
jgi:hypothetical protein